MPALRVHRHFDGNARILQRNLLPSFVAGTLASNGKAQNRRGTSAGPSAIRSSCGYFARSGYGTLTFVPLSIAINSSAFTTSLP